MVDRAKKISELTAVTTAVAGDLLPIVSNTAGAAVTTKITIGNLLSNTANVHASFIRTVSAPATASANGVAGNVRYDTNYIYICTSTNTWKRVAISTW